MQTMFTQKVKTGEGGDLRAFGVLASRLRMLMNRQSTVFRICCAEQAGPHEMSQMRYSPLLVHCQCSRYHLSGPSPPRRQKAQSLVEFPIVYLVHGLNGPRP